MTQTIPVIDVFAGPGGLGEGFTSYADSKGRNPFRVALSIEKDPSHTPRWRCARFSASSRIAMYRRAITTSFEGRRPPTRSSLHHPREARAAAIEAWQAELGQTSVAAVRGRIREALARKNPWVLIGGPPCQAYSIAGRSRNKGIETYDPDRDSKQTLYVEYLQIIADHRPAVFVMENVKGLLSATLSAKRVFDAHHRRSG